MKEGADQRLLGWIARNHGVDAYFLLERGQLETLRRLLPAGLVVVDDSNNKLLLARARL